MKDEDIKKIMVELQGFMWKAQLYALKAKIAIDELEKLYKTASLNLELLEDTIKNKENANKEHPENSE